MFNPHINNGISIPAKNNKVSFRSTERRYQLDNDCFNISMGNLTYLFRNDIDWLKLAKYTHKLFQDKDKVNIIQFGASSGAEAYTKIISLIETGNVESAKKFFPIKAYDIDPTIIEVAKSGFINLDRLELSNFTLNNFSVRKYFSPHHKKLSLENDVDVTPQNTYMAENILKNNVVFEAGDMFKLVQNIKDDSNTIVLCRNVLAYFNRDLQEKFIQDISSKLKEKSLLVIGDFDADFGLLPLLEKYRFKKIIKNVYQKIDNKSTPMENYQEKPQITIGELLRQAHYNLSNK